MREMPRKAQLYYWVVCLAGLSAAIGAIRFPGPQASAQPWEYLFFLALACLAGSKRVHLIRDSSAKDAGSMSIGFIITFASILRFGPAAGVVIGSAGCLSGCLFPKRQPIYQIVFNVALSALQTGIAGRLFSALNGGPFVGNALHTFEAVTPAVLIYYAINTGCVATIIALCSGRNVWQVWKQSFLWTAPGYFAAAFISTLAMVLCGRNMSAILLLTSPVAFLTYQSYAIYTTRAQEKQQHIEELRDSQEELAELYLATVKSLALAIDAKDQHTHQHILRVQRYAVATARQLGLSGKELEGINTGALLHDIGKLGVPEYVLLKPGRLTEEEFAKIKKHPEIGAAILDPVHFPWPVLPGVKYHHEKWDGTGYPEGLKGEDIPLAARILAVADVYDALTSSRSYRNAWTHERAIDLVKRHSGSHFDPKVVEAFLQVIEDVVEEMAREGYGPLANPMALSRPPESKADEAVRAIQRASSELWALYEVAQTLSSSLGLQETLDILARKLEAILPGATCLFLLKDEQSGMLMARAVVGINQEFFVGAHTLNAESRSLLVARTQHTYLGEYDPDDLLLSGVQTAAWTPLKSALIVPIVHQGEMLGTINLYHTQPNVFGPHDQQLLETIGERAAMALYNGILFDRTRSHAFTDPLTGLYNVRYLTEYVDNRCSDVLAQNENRHSPSEAEQPVPEAQTEVGQALRITDTFALLCLDLDSFKPINDNFGHQKGDQVLRDLSRIFLGTVRDQDVVARYGGDEFLIVLENAGPTEAERMAQRLQHAVERYDPGLIHPKLGALRLGVSIGFACFPEDGLDCATLLSAADGRMYTDKTDRKLGVMAERNKVQSAEEEAAFERLPNVA